jgi:hypothetical protein
MRTLAVWLPCAAAVSAVVLLGLGCVEQERDKPTADDLASAKANLLTTPPSPRYPVNADLDGKVLFLGIDADPVPVEAGKDLKLTQYFKVVAPPGDGWRTFTHLEGPGKQNYVNADHTPVEGKYPVSAWKAGDIVRDVHTVRVPDGWSFPALEVYVGLWRGAERLPVKSGPHDAEGRVLAASLPVRPASATQQRRRYVARMVAKPPKIDGKLDDAA